jgi:hypothetical protein
VSAERFLRDVSTAIRADIPIGDVAGANIPCFIDTQLPAAALTPSLAAIVSAIEKQQQLSIEVLAMDFQATVQSMQVAPTALVQAAGAWNLHAYSEDHGWIDVPLESIRRAQPLAQVATHVAHDSPELRLVEICLAPHPLLTPEQARLVAQLWSMTRGQVRLTMTQSQARTFLERYVATGEDDGPPWRLLVECTP